MHSSRRAQPAVIPAARNRWVPAFGTTEVEAAFRRWSPAGVQAVTYSESWVPVGAAVDVETDRQRSFTQVDLKVEGLRPWHAYGAHFHQRACGADPEAAGSHYQNVSDPVTPSTNPRYANPNNEVWLDFRTGEDGDGTARAVVPFALRTGAAAPQSLVIHAHRTMTGMGMAGTAGARLACVNLTPTADAVPGE
jgi:Cu-Zn family superoxide dismutase